MTKHRRRRTDHTEDTRRTLTPAAITEQQRDAVRLGPGIWLDRDGDVHFSVPELLAMVDLADTPENREAVARTIAETWRGRGPIIRQDPER